MLSISKETIMIQQKTEIPLTQSSHNVNCHGNQVFGRVIFSFLINGNHHGVQILRDIEIYVANMID